MSKKTGPNLSRIRSFRTKVREHYRTHGRHDLPWRQTQDPYKILVSEIMLQQTQVERVIPYYEKFLTKFPTAQSLARSKLSAVLTIWSGLGYNRRAKYVHDTAKTVLEKYEGRFPSDFVALRGLHGVGDYTARAVRVFAFNEPDILIETNIRTAILHDFYASIPKNLRIDDRELVELARRAAKGQEPRSWHWALMDYGAYLKRSGIRLNQKSAHYVKQAKFEGSNRELRGKLLRRLMDGPITKTSFKDIGAKGMYQISMALNALERDGLIQKHRDGWRLV